MRALALLLLVVACGEDAKPIAPEVTDPLIYVDPRIGSGGLGFSYGSCFVGAVAPHGLVKVGPGSNGPLGVVNFQHYSGYYAEDDKVRGFSHVHLHGAGATDYGVLSIMPLTAFDPGKLTVTANETRFTKSSELASAGSYQVTFVNGIEAAMTATQRAAVHRVRGAGAILIDLGKTLESGEIDSAHLDVDAAAREITGELHHMGGMTRGFGGYTIYFVIRAAAPWTAHRVWSAGNPPSAATSASGTAVGAAIDVSGEAQLAVGISLVSLAGARLNLDAEVPAVDFDATLAKTRAEWTRYLGTVLLTGGDDAERRIFYTSLYHAYLMPSVIDDVDGTYKLVGATEQKAIGWHQMSDLSLWDTYRTVHPLYAWLAPTSARDAARSLVGFGQGIGIFPKWPLAIGETGTMLGASAEIAIADAVVRGVPGVDADLAWPLLRATAMDATPPPAGRGGRNNVEEYMQLGYVPNTVNRSVSLTTEFTHDDFALAQLAGALGHTAEHDALLARSKSWRELYDPAVGFLRGKNPDGSFPTSAFDPLEMTDDYAEANAWHSLWMTGAHDPDGLVELLGSKDAALAKLGMFFDLAKEDWETADEAAANFPRPYYWHGNEPDINAAYIFAQLGDTDRANEWVRWIEDTHYSDQPDGVAGNDDGGTLGAWYVLSTLGVYPIPGSDRWILGAPRFPNARVIVDGRELQIISDGSSTRVDHVELDGVRVEGIEITHAQLVPAKQLKFVMK
jgi:predicted alpha-1,2-mannosidase